MSHPKFTNTNKKDNAAFKSSANISYQLAKRISNVTSSN